MKKILKSTVMILLFLTLSVSTAFLAYLQFFAPADDELSGEWVADLDMAEHASVEALRWLQTVEAVSMSLEDMKVYMRDLAVRVDLTMEQTARAGGTFRCGIRPESYDACKQAAYEAFARAFRAIVAERLRMAGYTEGTDDEAVEALVAETFGMSTVSYLMSCGPVLLPSLEDLQAQYDGSGTYEAAEGVLVRHYEEGGAAATKEERYIWKDSNLVLSEETGSETAGVLSGRYPMIYTLEQPENQ